MLYFKRSHEGHKGSILKILSILKTKLLYCFCFLNNTIIFNETFFITILGQLTPPTHFYFNPTHNSKTNNDNAENVYSSIFMNLIFNAFWSNLILQIHKKLHHIIDPYAILYGAILASLYNYSMVVIKPLYKT